MRFSALILIFASTLSLPFQALAAEPLEHHSQCVAIYINGIGIVNGGVYPAYIKKGTAFNVEFKLKNTGARAWKASEGYKLGTIEDSTIFGPSRALLPSGKQSVNTNEEVIFSVNAQPAANTSDGKYTYSWQMLRERIPGDPGGRFGQTCSVSLFVGETQPIAATPTASPADIEGKKNMPDIKTSTMCTDQSGNQTVSTSWSGYPTSSVKVFLKDETGLVDSSSCFSSSTQSYTFPESVPADHKYTVGFMPFSDGYCSKLDANTPAGGYNVDVANGGFTNPKDYTDPTIFHIKNIFVDFNGTRSKFNFDSCAPNAYSLAIPMGKNNMNSFDTPMNFLLTRFAAGTNGLVQRNDINTSHPVIIRYRPVISGSDGETYRVPTPSTKPATETGTTEEVSEP